MLVREARLQDKWRMWVWVGGWVCERERYVSIREDVYKREKEGVQMYMYAVIRAIFIVELFTFVKN